MASFIITDSLEEANERTKSERASEEEGEEAFPPRSEAKAASLPLSTPGKSRFPSPSSCEHVADKKLLSDAFTDQIAEDRVPQGSPAKI